MYKLKSHTESDFQWTITCNCEGIEQLRYFLLLIQRLSLYRKLGNLQLFFAFLGSFIYKKKKHCYNVRQI